MKWQNPKDLQTVEQLIRDAKERIFFNRQYILTVDSKWSEVVKDLNNKIESDKALIKIIEKYLL